MNQLNRLDYDAMIHSGDADKAAWEAFLEGASMSWLPLSSATDVVDDPLSTISAEFIDSLLFEELA